MNRIAEGNALAVWPAVGKAPNGQVDTSVSFGAKLNPGQSVSWGIDNHQLVRAAAPPSTSRALTCNLGHPWLGPHWL